MRPKFALLINASDRTSVGRFFWPAHFVPLWFSELTILLFMWPRVVGRVTGLKSELTGREADGILIGVGLSPRMLKICFGPWGKKVGLDNWARGRILNAIRFAQKQGATHIAITGQIGGGSLAQEIMTSCEKDPTMKDLKLTSGNHLTAAVAVRASIQRVLDRGLDPRTIKVGIVGCYGSIGACVAQLMAQGQWLPEGVRFCHFLLRGGEKRTLIEGLAGKLRRTAPTEITAEVLDSDHRLVECDLLIVSTSLDKPHIGPDQCMKGAIVCDLAVPHAVNSSVLRDRPDVDVFLGGAVLAPAKKGGWVRYGIDFGQDRGQGPSRWRKQEARSGACYACMAEIMTAVIDEEAEPCLTRKTLLVPSKAVALEALAERHGFRIVIRRRKPRRNPWLLWLR